MKSKDAEEGDMVSHRETGSYGIVLDVFEDQSGISWFEVHWLPHTAMSKLSPDDRDWCSPDDLDLVATAS